MARDCLPKHKRVELAMGSARVHATGMENFGLSGKSFRQRSVKPMSTLIIVWGIDELIERERGEGQGQNFRDYHQLRES